MGLKRLFSIFWPYLLIVLLIGIWYRPFFFKNLLPIPADITPGMYYPWFDDKYPEYPNNIPVKNPLPSDIVSLTYPLRQLSINLLKQGQWPLWNSYILSGTPLLANFQSAALYPLNLIYWFTHNFNLAWSWQIILQPILSIIFCFWWLRSYFGKMASVYSALIWGLGSFYSIWGQYNTVIHALLWLPLGLFAIKKLQDYPSSGILIAIAVAFSIYAGNPPMTLIVLIILSIYSLIVYTNKFNKIITIILFGITGLCLSAPLLLPGIVNMNLSIRDTDSVAVDNQIKYVHWRQLITTIVPDFFGNPTTLNHWAPGLYDNLTIYIGVIPLLLFLFSLYLPLSTNKEILVFSRIIILFSTLLIFDNPISKIIGSLPFLGLKAMVMSRWFPILTLGISASAGAVIDQIIKEKWIIKSKAPLVWLSTLWTIPALIVTINWLLFKDMPYADWVRINTFTSIRNLAIPLIIVSISISLVLLKNILGSKIIIIGFFILSLFEQYRFFQKYNTFIPEKLVFPDNKVMTYLKTNSTRFWRESGEISPSNMWMPYQLKSASGYDTLHSSRYNGVISLQNGSSIDHLTNRYLELDKTDGSVFDFLGISHLIVLKRDADSRVSASGKISYKIDQNRFPIEFEDRSTVVLKNPKAAPIVFSVNNFQIANNVQEMNRLLSQSDLTKTVILEKDIGQIKPDEDASLSNIQVTPQTTTLISNSSDNLLIVTSQTWDPGWQLTIDNKPSEILRANHAFMALVVPPGQHQISLNYYPYTFMIGKIIALVSVLILAISGVTSALRIIHYQSKS